MKYNTCIVVILRDNNYYTHVIKYYILLICFLILNNDNNDNNHDFIKLPHILNMIIKHNTDHLNKHYIDNLLGLVDNWDNILFTHRVELQDGWWDINTIFKHILTSLNYSNDLTPYPRYPKSPLHNTYYVYDDIKKIYDRLLLLDINMYYNFHVFCKYICRQQLTLSDNILSIFLKKMRFKVHIEKNNIYGEWVYINSPLSKLEHIYSTLNAMHSHAEIISMLKYVHIS
jgi:hypothetical protein